ncbi:MAG: rhomboid family intramembrane serine protease [archaeon]
MDDDKEIEPESKFLLKLIYDVLLTPVTLVLVMLGKREWGDLFKPFYDMYEFLFEAKFTITIIIANVAVTIFAAFFLSSETFNALINYPSNLLDYRRYYTLVTAGFLHGSLVHLFWNMFGIFIFSRSVERKLGSAKTAMVYFGALVISSAFYSAINLFLMGSDVPAIGASGALMGIIAAAILLDPFGITFSSVVPLPNMICGWFAIYADISGLLSNANDGIAHVAHVGGFLSVTVLMFLLNRDERYEMEKGIIINLFSLVVIGVIFFLVTSGYLPSFDFGGSMQQAVFGNIPI